jgi:hypothetical protein
VAPVFTCAPCVCVCVCVLLVTCLRVGTAAQALGLGNILCGVFGSMGGCALIGTTVINQKSGGVGRLSSFSAGATVLVIILAGHVPHRKGEVRRRGDTGVFLAGHIHVLHSQVHVHVFCPLGIPRCACRYKAINLVPSASLAGVMVRPRCLLPVSHSRFSAWVASCLFLLLIACLPTCVPVCLVYLPLQFMVTIHTFAWESFGILTSTLFRWPVSLECCECVDAHEKLALLSLDRYECW